MPSRCRTLVSSLIAVAVAGSSLIVVRGQTQAVLPLEPGARSGQSVTPAFEGGYPNAAGSFDLLLGYYNRNDQQVLPIPGGPNNRIAPGRSEQGQPTHFLARPQYFVFTITVPKD